MSQKRRNYYLDWWKIKKSTIYGLIALIAVIGGISYGLWWISKSNFLTTVGTVEKPADAGELLSFEGDVRIIRAQTREVVRVTTQTYVFAGDTVQTQSDGRAQIKMIDGSLLTVRPNSTVVIRDSASIFGGTNVKVLLNDGQINVRTEDQTEASKNIVEVKEVENQLKERTEASFNVNQQTNMGEIRITRGTIQSTSGSETTTLKENEYVAINQGNKLSAKERLLEPPRLISPAALDQLLTTSSGTADTTFRWTRNDGTGGFTFRLEVAQSPFFVPDSMLIARDGLGAPNLSLGNINPGTYYWRVRSTAPSGQASEWSEPWRFTVLKREGGDMLAASDWAVEPVSGKVYIISGKTKPGATVRIGAREIFAGSDGMFRLQVSVPTREVTAEIRDEHGNQTHYVLSVVNAKVLRQY